MSERKEAWEIRDIMSERGGGAVVRRSLKIVLLFLLACVVTVLLIFFGSAFFFAQRADYAWSPAVSEPTFGKNRPLLLFDEAHHNASTTGFAGRYWPFARLLRADGYRVVRNRDLFTASRLGGVEMLVIANASGAAKPQIFGMNVPLPERGSRSDPAFTAGEIETIAAWVEKGGSLLLIADHAPFGEAAANLSSALGVTMHKGFVEVPGEVSDPLLFSKEDGRLGDHPIVNGDSPSSRVTRVMTFTGQSLSGPDGATVLLRLPDTAVEAVPEGDSLVSRKAGPAQALAFAKGRGRVVVLGEAGMATAQVSRRVRFGMNTPGNDNRQFILNTMHWLSHKL